MWWEWIFCMKIKMKVTANEANWWKIVKHTKENLDECSSVTGFHLISGLIRKKVNIQTLSTLTSTLSFIYLIWLESYEQLQIWALQHYSYDIDLFVDCLFGQPWLCRKIMIHCPVCFRIVYSTIISWHLMIDE